MTARPVCISTDAHDDWFTAYLHDDDDHDDDDDLLIGWPGWPVPRGLRPDSHSPVALMQAGAEAARVGLGKQECPFSPSSREGSHWLYGWTDARAAAERESGMAALRTSFQRARAARDLKRPADPTAILEGDEGLPEIPPAESQGVYVITRVGPALKRLAKTSAHAAWAFEELADARAAWGDGPWHIEMGCDADDVGPDSASGPTVCP